MYISSVMYNYVLCTKKTRLKILHICKLVSWFTLTRRCILTHPNVISKLNIFSTYQKRRKRKTIGNISILNASFSLSFFISTTKHCILAFQNHCCALKRPKRPLLKKGLVHLLMLSISPLYVRDIFMI